MARCAHERDRSPVVVVVWGWRVDSRTAIRAGPGLQTRRPPGLSCGPGPARCCSATGHAAPATPSCLCSDDRSKRTLVQNSSRRIPTGANLWPFGTARARRFKRVGSFQIFRHGKVPYRRFISPEASAHVQVQRKYGWEPSNRVCGARGAAAHACAPGLSTGRRLMPMPARCGAAAPCRGADYWVRSAPCQCVLGLNN